MKTRGIIFLLLLLSTFNGNAQSTKDELQKPKPFVLGTVVEIYSKELNEKRTLNIYLPEGYNDTDTTHYQVIYLLDGSADEDFIHVAGLVQFNNFPWIERFPKSIVVGIANIDRRRDFSLPTSIEADKKRWPTTGGSQKFISFIEKDLQPYIQKQYKTNSSRMLIGQSFGGLLATEILLKKPALFNQYVIISPSLWWNDGSLLKEKSALLDSTYSEQTSVYIGVGKEGLAPGASTHVMEVDANLLAEKLSLAKNKKVKVYFDYLPEENHATIGHQAVINAFRKFYFD